MEQSNDRTIERTIGQSGNAPSQRVELRYYRCVLYRYQYAYNGTRSCSECRCEVIVPEFLVPRGAACVARRIQRTVCWATVSIFHTLLLGVPVEGSRDHEPVSWTGVSTE
jgi:hypothetical protein